jgi:predicted ATP-binding protein involved in virulence
MKILKIVFQNFKSYGNKKVSIDFENDFNSDLILLSGKNGSGKCLDPNTTIDIIFDSQELMSNFEEFLKK